MDTTGKLLVIRLNKDIRWGMWSLVALSIFVALMILAASFDLIRQTLDPDYRGELEREHQSQSELNERLRQIENRHQDQH